MKERMKKVTALCLAAALSVGTVLPVHAETVQDAQNAVDQLQQQKDSVLYNIVDAYNKTEVERAKKEHRKAELLPKFSAHVMRHTACTRMAECRMDVKVLQYIMGHAHIDVTMEVYNHIGELTRIENEIARLDSMVLNA